MSDITTRADIDLVVKELYEKLMVDEIVGHFFTQVVPIDLDKHLPVVADFWESILLFNPVYNDNPMIKHIVMHQKSPILPEHFARWLELWEKSVNDNFEGKVATEAVERARGIAGVMEIKVGHFS